MIVLLSNLTSDTGFESTYNKYNEKQFLKYRSA